MSCHYETEGVICIARTVLHLKMTYVKAIIGATCVVIKLLNAYIDIIGHLLQPQQ